MKNLFLLFALMTITYSMRVLAQDATVTDPTDFISGIIELFKMIKAGQVGIIGIASAVLALILQAFKLKVLQRFVEGNKVLTLAITSTVGIAIGVLTAISTGMPWTSALIAGLVTQGGAITLYNVWKALFKKD